MARKIEEEYVELANRNSWSALYKSIDKECQKYPYQCTEARKPCNKTLNRYRDVHPYDHSRIILKGGDQDYINANLVKVESAGRSYILTQGPLSFTVGHFWTMVWQQNSIAIIMLNKLVEKNELKCFRYWPTDTGDENKLDLDDVDMSIELIREVHNQYYIVRTLKVTNTKERNERTVTQFHYTTWPDFEVPTSPVAFLEFLERVWESGGLDADKGPAIVHCSAGIGRSGTFCLVDSALHLIDTNKSQENVDVKDLLLQMRKYRMGLIQTAQQLRFSYEAIVEGITRMNPDRVKLISETVGEPNLKSMEPNPAEVEEDEPTPVPPPRVSSLQRPPMRPLPYIPKTSSTDEDSRLAGAATGSAVEEPNPNNPSSLMADHGSESVESSLDAMQDRVRARRAKNEQLAEKIEGMKKRSREADKQHSSKRSMLKIVAISGGVFLFGVALYTYFKR